MVLGSDTGSADKRCNLFAKKTIKGRNLSLLLMKKLFYSTVLALLLPLISPAQTFNTSRVDSLLELLNHHQRWMGSMAISHRGNTVYSRALGFADVAKKELAGTGTRYSIGSITKMFTAVLILKAVEQGKLSLGEKLGSFFPEIPNSGEITIEQMLGHQSGIASITSQRDFEEWSKTPVTREEMVLKTGQTPSLFQPGSQTRYSNSNYILLTYILEDVTEQTYKELLRKEITEPLGLTHTYVSEPEISNNHESHAYKFLGVWEEIPQRDPSVTLGAGFLYSTPEDLNRFAEAFFKGEILQPTSMERMLTFRDEMGLGVHEFSFGDVKSIGHTGSIDGFISYLGFVPEEELSISFISNGMNYPHGKFTQMLYAMILDPSAVLPEFEQVRFESGELERFIGVYGTPQAALKIKITQREGYLLAQATGQEAFTLEATEKTSFKFEPAGLVIDFLTEESALILRQVGKDMKFVKE